MPDIEIKRGYEVLPDNNVRFGVRVINNSDSAISDVEVILDYNGSLFELEGNEVQKLGNIPPAVPRTAKFILKPLGCIHKEEIGATVLYKDYQWKKHTEEMRPKEVHCVCPFLKEKALTEAEFVNLSKAGPSAEQGINFENIDVDRMVYFLTQMCRNRLYKVAEYKTDKGKILYLASESVGEKAYYLLTAVVNEYEGLTQVMLRASSDKSHGLNGFLNEIMENLHHVADSIRSAREVGIIRKEQVINIIDSVVQRTTFAGGEGAASVNIKDSVVQRAEIKGEEEEEKEKEHKKIEERKAQEEAERRRIEEEQRRERKEKYEAYLLKQKEEAERKEREKNQREAELLRKSLETQRIDREFRERQKEDKKFVTIIIKVAHIFITFVKMLLKGFRIFGEILRKVLRILPSVGKALYVGLILLLIFGSMFSSVISPEIKNQINSWVHNKTGDAVKYAASFTDAQGNLKSTPSLTTTGIATTTTTPLPTPVIGFSADQKTFNNSIGMEFVLIPAGEFDMGSPESETGRGNNEGQVHRVKITKVFYMGKYEVTQKQWRDITGNNPSSNKKGDDLPVEQVSWVDVQEFIDKLNEKEGTNKYRLPSESEWEYAARAGTTTSYFFGDSPAKLYVYAWYSGNSDGKTHPVGQKNPNSWGLYDMYGNVEEWVQDVYQYDYKGAPADGSAWEGAGSSQVERGGNYNGEARYHRSAYRDSSSPGSRYSSIGFRLVRDPGEYTSTTSALQTSALTQTSTSAPATVAPAGKIVVTKIVANRFGEPTLLINVGDELQWNNYDDNFYTLREMNNRMPNITIKSSGRKNVRFNATGTYRFGLYYNNMQDAVKIQTISVVLNTSIT